MEWNVSMSPINRLIVNPYTLPLNHEQPRVQGGLSTRFRCIAQYNTNHVIGICKTSKKRLIICPSICRTRNIGRNCKFSSYIDIRLLQIHEYLFRHKQQPDTCLTCTLQITSKKMTKTDISLKYMETITTIIFNTIFQETLPPT